MIDFERRIFIDKNAFSLSYSRFCAEIENYTVNIYYMDSKNRSVTLTKKYHTFEECFKIVEQLSEHQGTLEGFEKELEKVLNYKELL